MLWLIQMTSVKPRRWLARLFAKKAEQTCASSYHAVEIRCATNACQAAQDSKGERHLSADAPLLPLDACDRPDQCKCRYQHYEDRRSGSRRDSEHSPSIHDKSEHVERRLVKGRRKEDVPEDAEPFSVSEGSYYEHVGDTVRTALLDVSKSEGIDPYNSGSFDKSKSWKSNSGK